MRLLHHLLLLLPVLAETGLARDASTLYSTAGVLVPRQSSGGNDTQSAPMCAALCAAKALPKSYCISVPAASIGDCMCNNEQLGAEITACVMQSCTVKEQLRALAVSRRGCGEVPRDESRLLFVTVIVLCVVSTLTVSARLLYKVVVLGAQELGWDDLFIALTIVSGVVPSLVITISGTLRHGLGKDIWGVPVDDIYEFLKWHYVNSIVYFVQVGLLKMSLIFFYIRIFPARNIQRLLWATVAFNAAATVAFTLMNALQCAPKFYLFWSFWDGEHPESQCGLSFSDISISNAAVSIALDLWMLGVPIWQLRGLQLHWKKKLGVAMMFIVGTFFTVISFIRLKILLDIERTLVNVTYDQLPITMWSVIEITVGIICTCMPIMRLILVRVFPALASTTVRSYGGSSHPSGGGGPSYRLGSSAYAKRSSMAAARAKAVDEHQLKSLGSPVSPVSPGDMEPGHGIGVARATSPASTGATMPPSGAIRMQTGYSVTVSAQYGGKTASDSDDNDDTRLIIMSNTTGEIVNNRTVVRSNSRIA